MAEEKVGVVTHYFGNIGVAAIKLTDGALSVGERGHSPYPISHVANSIQTTTHAVNTIPQK